MNTKREKNKFSYLREVIYGAMIVIIVLFGVLMIMSAFGIPSVLRILVVQSGSMEPAIGAGSVIFAIPQDEYRTNDIITFTPSEKDTNIPVTHRIVDIESEGEPSSYITKGDANDIRDLDPIKYDQILGRVRFFIPYLGYPISFAKTPIGFIILIVIPATLIIQSEARTVISETKNMIRNRRKNVNKEDSVNE